MSDEVPTTLFFKSLLVYTPLESAAKQVRWWWGAKQRWRHPELWELYLEEIQVETVLRRLLKPDSCCVDVGAHIGSVLSLFHKLAPEGRHYAFEPSPTKCKWLKRKFSNAEIFELAVGELSESRLFKEDLQRPGFSRLIQNPQEDSQNSAYSVRVCRLDDALRDVPRLDFIKLDIEGHEFSALRGAVATIGKFKPSILFECGTEGDFERLEIDRHEMFEFITDELEYRIYTFADFLFDRGHLEFEEFRRCGVYPFKAFNFVALPSR